MTRRGKKSLHCKKCIDFAIDKFFAHNPKRTVGLVQILQSTNYNTRFCEIFEYDSPPTFLIRVERFKNGNTSLRVSPETPSVCTYGYAVMTGIDASREMHKRNARAVGTSGTSKRSRGTSGSTRERAPEGK